MQALMSRIEAMRQKELFVKDRTLCLKFMSIFQEVQCLLGDFILALSKEDLGTMVQVCHQAALRCSIVLKNHLLPEELYYEICNKFNDDRIKEILLEVPLTKISTTNAMML